jgi:hypothetical protein
VFDNSHSYINCGRCGHFRSSHEDVWSLYGDHHSACLAQWTLRHAGCPCEHFEEPKHALLAPRKVKKRRKP